MFIEWVSSGFSMDLPPKADFIIPFFKTISYPLGVWGFIALTYFVIVGTSNAVNLTDGLDGLTIMPTIMVGTAHGKYKQAPVLAIDRIAEIHAAMNAHLVLHGGSGVPDDQICAAVKAGIRKINFGTDVCCAFIETYAGLDPYAAPLDVVMAKAADAVEAFALEKIRLLGAK